ncbi:MAG: glycerol-3-phosphate dehydrogenase subunit GlpB [Propionibacteriaceae bacterium]|nr:glycerol-3-phosphate dehydrogenase subunit GlpB [Propionibacteriaceae bacterium]
MSRTVSSATVVIGAGLAGLTSAIALAKAGQDVTLITKGLGGLTLSQGSIDIWGRTGAGLVTDPAQAVADAPAGHPYAVAGADAVRAGAEALCGWLDGWFEGDLHHTRLVPTAVGAWRPTCLVPAGHTVQPAAGQRWVVVGPRRMKDIQPELIAGNLARTPLPDGGFVRARGVGIDIAARAHEVDSSGVAYARALDEPSFRATFAEAVKAVVHEGEIVALPAILGLNDPEAFADLSKRIGHPLCEIVTPPPSVPGMRLDQALRAYAQQAGVRIVLGAAVLSATTDGDRVVSVDADTAGHVTTYAADAFVLAAGGFESGALEYDSTGTLSETIFGLPVTRAPGAPVVADYWADQPLFEAGLSVDASMRPLGQAGKPVCTNLHAAGGVIGGAVRWREKSGEGIALGTAWAAATAIEEATK